jgi:anti-anti-sigma factor
VPVGEERVAPERSTTVTRPAASEPGLDVNTIVTASKGSIDAAGEIDYATAGRLLTAFQAAADGAGSELVLDLARVTFVDSVGLRTVIDIERRAQERGLSLQIIPPPERVRAVFRLSGTERYLRFSDQLTGRSAERDYPERVELELPARADAPRKARRAVREATTGKLSPPESEVAALLVSELVTNAVMHPEHGEKDSIGLRISADSGRVRVEVADSGGGFDPTAPRNDKAVGGRGLMIVDRGAVRWGTRRDDRFRVWFEVS